MSAGKPIRIAILASGRQARAELAATGAAGARMGQSLKTAGVAATGMGRTLDRVVKAGAALFLAERAGHYAKEFVDQATKFQSATQLLVTAGGEAQSALKGVQSGILKVSSATGTSSDQLAEGMYTIEKAGYRAADGLKVLKNAAEGARAENVDMATMTQAVTSVMTSYHVAAGKSAQVVNELVAASGAAKETMQNFASSLATVLPSASAAGLSFAQVGGAIATLTQHGTSAAEATQELANTIRNLQAPNNVASQQMQQLGIDVTDLSKNLGKRGLTGTLDLVVGAITKHMGKSGLVMQDAFRKSKSAGADLQIMLKSMPKPLADVSKGFLEGSVSAKDYRKDFKDMGGSASAMGQQFMGLVNQSQGFNNLLRSGNPAAQTFASALKKVTGGATGMNTALQLSGENMAGFKGRVDEITKAAKSSSDNVSTWAKTQKTLAVQVDRLKTSLQAAGIKIMLPLLPKLTKGFEKSADAVNDLGNALKPVSKLLDAVPSGVKKIGIEAGIAALILPRLSAATTATTTAIADQITYLRVLRLEMAETAASGGLMTAAMGRLGGMTKTVAGVGGLLALTDGAQRSNKALGGLEEAAGGAALGFSLGGPWGAAIGGVAGGLLGIVSAARKSSKAMNDARQPAADYASSLNQITGAATRSTRAVAQQALAQSGAIKAANAMHISTRDLVSATLGNEGALKRVNALINKNGYALAVYGDGLGHTIVDQHNMTKSALTVITALTGQSKSLNKQISDTRAAALATESLSKVMHGVPRTIATKIVQSGNVNDMRQRLLAYVRAGKLAPKQITTVLRAIGLPSAKKDVDALVKTANDSKKKLSAAGKSGGKAATDGAAAGVVDGAAKMKGALNNLVSKAATQVKGSSKSGGNRVGAAMSLGVALGIGVNGGLVNGAAHTLIANALAEMKSTAKSHSPSKATIKLGQDMGDGLILGINARRQKAVKAMSGVIKAMLASATTSRGSLESYLRKYLDTYTKLSTKAISKRLKSHGKVEAALTKEASKIAMVTKAYQGQNYTLEKANQLLKDRKQALSDYIAQVRSAIISTGDLTQMSVPFTPGGEIAGLQNAVDKAREYASLLNQLRAAGLNHTTLQQLVDAGVNGGLATAQALVDGIRSGAIGSINALQSQLNSIAGGVANSMGHTMNDAGIQAAQALVNGIKKKQKPLIKQFKHLADVLLNELVRGSGTRASSSVPRSGSAGYRSSRISATGALSAAQTTSRSNTYHITVHVPPNANQAQVGKQIVKAVNAYEKSKGSKVRL